MTFSHVLVSNSVVLAMVLGGTTAGNVRAQAVRLELRPHLGDTLYLRLEQQMEMRGVPHNGADSTRVMTANLRVRARAIPTSYSGAVTNLTAITDSLVMSPTPPDPNSTAESVRRRVEGRRTEVRVNRDGAMEAISQDRSDDPSPLFGQTPAILPGEMVRPGDRWAREMVIPLTPGRRTPAAVRAVFRFDSLTADGGIAYVSVRGTLTAQAASRPFDAHEFRGTLTGTLEIDRRLGWITDSRTTVTATSHVSARDPRASPVDVWMKITQRIHAQREQ